MVLERRLDSTFISLSSKTFKPNSFVIDPPSQSRPVNLGFLGSVTLYCLRSPWSQLDRYRYLSSMDSKMSSIIWFTFY